MEGKIKSFQDKQKLKEFMNTKPALQVILKGILRAGNRYQKLQELFKPFLKGTQTIYRNSDFTSNTMALNSYLSIITLNVNRLNALIKIHTASEWIKKEKKKTSKMLLTRDSF